MEEAEITGTVVVPPEAPAPPSRQEITAKHWAVRVNIKSLSDNLREAADLALAGKLKRTWQVQSRASSLLRTICFQLTEIAVATNPKQTRRPKRKRGRPRVTILK